MVPDFALKIINKDKTRTPKYQVPPHFSNGQNKSAFDLTILFVLLDCFKAALYGIQFWLVLRLLKIGRKFVFGCFLYLFSMHNQVPQIIIGKSRMISQIKAQS